MAHPPRLQGFVEGEFPLFEERKRGILPHIPMEITLELPVFYAEIETFYQRIRSGIFELLQRNSISYSTPKEMLYEELLALKAMLEDNFHFLKKTIRLTLRKNLENDYSPDNMGEIPGYSNTLLKRNSGLLHRLGMGLLMDMFFGDMAKLRKLIENFPDGPEKQLHDSPFRNYTVSPGDQN